MRVCRAREEAEVLLRQAVAAVVADCGRPVLSGAAVALAVDAEAAIRARIRHVCDQIRQDGGNEVSAAVAGRLTAESLLHERHRSALRALGRGPAAKAEAKPRTLSQSAPGISRRARTSPRR
ncbi:hypothetical protein ACH4GK_38090 [Streptomyces rimosus]|uniref:hypothetical protein n=1 Tax=Streptomyces rimosus TaxID=1927 RepID=UPI0004C5676D|nr:hypothetical protein [Streptomyces rimosus]